MSRSGEIVADIISMPSDINDLTDEEQFDDDNLASGVVADVSGTLGITIPYGNDNSVISENKERNYVNVKEKYRL